MIDHCWLVDHSFLVLLLTPIFVVVIPFVFVILLAISLVSILESPFMVPKRVGEFIACCWNFRKGFK